MFDGFISNHTGLRDSAPAATAFGELFKKEYVLTRTLVEGSMEVYPIKNYGAIQTGRHIFCHMENGKKDCGAFKFLHIWRNEQGQWKLAKL